MSLGKERKRRVEDMRVLVRIIRTKRWSEEKGEIAEGECERRRNRKLKSTRLKRTREEYQWKGKGRE